jgi:hypothetical protein
MCLYVYNEVKLKLVYMHSALLCSHSFFCWSCYFKMSMDSCRGENVHGIVFCFVLRLAVHTLISYVNPSLWIVYGDFTESRFFSCSTYVILLRLWVILCLYCYTCSTHCFPGVSLVCNMGCFSFTDITQVRVFVFLILV